MFRKILFPVDLSCQSRRVAPFVRSMTECEKAELTLLHVTSPDSEDLRTGLAGLAKAFFPAATLTTEEGEPADVIVQFATGHQFDLIMIASFGHCGHISGFLGSQTARILNSAPGPVWVTGHALPPKDYMPRTAPEAALCALDLGPASAQVLDFAKQFCEPRHIRPVIVHSVAMPTAFPMTRFDYEYRDYLITKAHAGIKRLQHTACTDYEVCIAPGEIAGLIRGTVLRNHADMLIMGRGESREFRGRLNGDSYSIIRECPCPVLSV